MITETNLTIMISDMDKSIAFYESIGFSLKKRWESHYAMLSAPGITIGLHPGGKGIDTNQSVSVGMMVKDAAEAKALLEKNGIAFTYHDDDKGSGIYLHFKDPDGIELYFSQPKWSYED